MKKKILTVFDDPGGGLAVASVAEKLKEDPDIELTVYTGKLSETISENAGLKFKGIGSMITNEIAEEILNTVSPDLLLTATGSGNAEQVFRNIAYRKYLPSVVILDFWKDYKRRWMYADHEISEMKDMICVMDDLTKKEMTEEGFPGKGIAVTGHPYLDKIFHNNKSLYEKSDHALVNILFFSQPLEIIGIKEYKIHPFKILKDAVSEYSEKSGREVNLKIKLHPSEKMSDELSEILDDVNINNLKIKTVSREDELQDLIKEADIVFGYNSIALFNARAMGKRVVSLNLFSMKESLRKAFYEAGIESVNAVTENLSEILNCKKESKSIDNIFKGGIVNCIEVISKELKLKEQTI